MPEFAGPAMILAVDIPAWLNTTILVGLVLLGFSLIIFFHELGHFLAAKWVGVRVDRFAVGFGPRVVGWRAGEGLTFGRRPDYRADELERYGYGETDYCLRALPIGGYVKMLGQEDIVIDEKTGDIHLSDDPRAFTSRPVGQRMIVVSAGVTFNLLLAAILLTGIFLIGKPETAPIVGGVQPQSSAFGMLKEGDRILKVNGWHVDSFEDILLHSVLVEEDLQLRIQRDGRELTLDSVPCDENRQLGLKMLNIEPAVTYVLSDEPLGQAAEGEPPRGDRILAIDDRPVQSTLDILVAFANSGGRALSVKAEPAPTAEGSQGQPRVVPVRPALALASLSSPEDIDVSQSDGDLLGFQRVQYVGAVFPGTPADRAGFKAGDAILTWGAIGTPTYAEIVSATRAGADQEARVRVLRHGQEVELTVVPRRDFNLFEQTDAKVGMAFATVVDTAAPPVVAAVAPGSLAAELNIPRGALITAIDGRPTPGWGAVAGALLDAAGRTVELAYRVGSEEVRTALAVPSSVVNELQIPPTAAIESIDGQRKHTWRDASGRSRDVLYSNPWAISQRLAECVGREVEIAFRSVETRETVKRTFRVRADNLDPWQLRVKYAPPENFRPEPLKELHKADNVLAAMMMGGGQVRDWVLEVYRFLKISFVRTQPSVKHVSGPVGIVNAAVTRFRMGVIESMYLLALLSVNLAVMNFLPIPVMDGGLMMFLLIEKIKGKPLSIKTQMISTLVGLAAIILVGVVVTFQDVARLFQP